MPAVEQDHHDRVDDGLLWPAAGTGGKRVAQREQEQLRTRAGPWTAARLQMALKMVQLQPAPRAVAKAMTSSSSCAHARLEQVQPSFALPKPFPVPSTGDSRAG